MKIMNSYILILSLLFIVVACGCTKTATKVNEDKKAMMEKDESMEGMEISFENINGTMFMVDEKTKKQIIMDKDEILKDGTKVMANGKVIRTNGTNFMLKEGESIWTDGLFMKAGEMMKDESMMKENSMMESEYKGKILAGKESLYIDFNKADYEKALEENKKILLYFYANWCPICKKEQPETFAAFNDLKDPDWTGFRVNYRDSDTDADEEALAKEFGVSYQHTKVILKNGERVGKFPDSWDKQRYLDELRKI